MKPLKNQASSIAGLSALSGESKLCFGASGGCFIIGAIGYGITALTTTETTLSAFLVISAFYLMLGVINLSKSSPKSAPGEPTADDRSGPSSANETKNDLIESAA